MLGQKFTILIKSE